MTPEARGVDPPGAAPAPLTGLRRMALFEGNSSPECHEAAERLQHQLSSRGYTVIRRREEFDARNIDLVILLGGDGFLMESVHALGCPPTPFFGVNFGSVGFLMNPRSSINDLVEAIPQGRFRVEDHPVLEARVKLAAGGEEVLLAVNDMVLERTGGQAARIRVLVNDVLLNEFSGDGVIVATAAGSTAYNLAAGGPVFHPRIAGVVVTPLYPHRAAPFHSLQFSVVLPLESRLHFSGLDIEKRPIRLLADGRPREGVAEVSVRDSGLRVHLLRTQSHLFIATLARKFIMPAVKA